MGATNEANNPGKDVEQLSQPLVKKGLFDNPWATWWKASIFDFLRWVILHKDHTNLPRNTKVLDDTLPVKMITDKEIEDFCQRDTGDKIRAIWIGHATCLINIENTIILLDPVFSERCSPSQRFGPKRFRPVPITIDRIPRVDAVVISHNHYDHLDHGSVLALQKRFGNKGENSLNWFVGMGTAAWFRDCGVSGDAVHELNWWQSKKFKNLEFVFTPSQHWCARGIFDRNKCLWGSWTVIGPKHRFFFAGDTGYCTAFNEIGKKYGPFNLSAIPIGAYEPRWFMEPQHVDPEQAVQLHIDVKSKKSIAVHWGTFALAYEFYLEPPVKLKEAMEKYCLEKEDFITVQHGETREF